MIKICLVFFNCFVHRCVGFLMRFVEYLPILNAVSLLIYLRCFSPAQDSSDDGDSVKEKTANDGEENISGRRIFTSW